MRGRHIVLRWMAPVTAQACQCPYVAQAGASWLQTSPSVQAVALAECRLSGSHVCDVACAGAGGGGATPEVHMRQHGQPPRNHLQHQRQAHQGGDAGTSRPLPLRAHNLPCICAYMQALIGHLSVPRFLCGRPLVSVHEGPREPG